MAYSKITYPFKSFKLYKFQIVFENYIFENNIFHIRLHAICSAEIQKFCTKIRCLERIRLLHFKDKSFFYQRWSTKLYQATLCPRIIVPAKVRYFPLFRTKIDVSHFFEQKLLFPTFSEKNCYFPLFRTKIVISHFFGQKLFFFFTFSDENSYFPFFRMKIVVSHFFGR